MRSLKLWGAALTALIVYAVMATSASAELVELPDLHVLPTETYPLHLEVTYLTNSKFENTGAEGLESRESEGGSILLLFLINQLTALGTFELLLTHVRKIKNGLAGEECNTEGDGAGLVLVPVGTFHLVFISKTPELRVGALFLIKEFVMICNKLKIKFRGSVLTTLLKPPATESEKDTNLISAGLHGSKGKPDNTKYFNDEAIEVTIPKLESNFGTGFLETDESIEKEAKLHSLCCKLFSILPW
jgi:hypothetical protein